MKSLILVFCCALSLYANEIKVAVAANVSYAFDELVETFSKQNPHTKIVPIFSSSGNLNAQIQNKAPFSLFLSANMKYPQRLYELGLATKPKVYAKGVLAVLSKKDIPLDKNLKFLQDKSIKKIALANPNAAPYGMMSVQVLKNAKLYDGLKDKFVYGQNISQSLIYALNVADLGFVAKSALFSPKLKKDFKFCDVDLSLYEPMKQGISIVKGYENNLHVKAFYDFILSAKAKEVFKRYGYLVNE